MRFPLLLPDDALSNIWWPARLKTDDQRRNKALPDPKREPILRIPKNWDSANVCWHARDASAHVAFVDEGMVKRAFDAAVGHEFVFQFQLLDRRSDLHSELRLLQAVMLLAIVDLLMQRAPATSHSARRRERNGQEAARWLNGEGRAPISFLDCAAALGMEPAILRGRVQSAIERATHRSGSLYLGGIRIAH